MPMWQIYIAEGALSAEDKIELGSRITSIYSDNFDLNMPRFYTTVYFHEYKPAGFVVGGEVRDKYVVCSILHIARSHEEVAEHLGIDLKTLNDTFIEIAHDALNPYIAERGYELELFIQMSAREHWTIDGIYPPPPWSDAELQWTKDNHSSPFVLADQ